eukprot:5924612-Prymnesium_polylepis.1
MFSKRYFHLIGSGGLAPAGHSVASVLPATATILPLWLRMHTASLVAPIPRLNLPAAEQTGWSNNCMPNCIKGSSLWAPTANS